MLQEFVGVLLGGPSDSLPSDFVVGVSARRLKLDSTSVSTHRTRAPRHELHCCSQVSHCLRQPTDPTVTRERYAARQMTIRLPDMHCVAASVPAGATLRTLRGPLPLIWRPPAAAAPRCRFLSEAVLAVEVPGL